MILLFFFIFLSARLTKSASEGDACSITDASPGACVLLKNCPSVLRELVAGNSPEKLCGYSGVDAVVCCPKIAPTTTSTSESSIIRTRDLQISDGRGAIARQKCAEYSEYVYALKYPPVGNRKPIRVSQCAIKSQKLVTGGTKAERKEFPHMAAVGYELNNADIGWYCGGTLISETFVLTAAHCSHLLGKGDAAWVRVGDLNLVKSDDQAKPLDRRVIERIKHPEYKPPAEYHDIALLRLESPVPFNDWIRPACLHTAPSTGTEKAIATGWGRVEWIDDAGSDALLKVTLSLVDSQTCNERWTTGVTEIKQPNGVIENWSICAGEPGKDTCQGDSGGPLVIFSNGTLYKCMYDVVGVTSVGKLCGQNFPGIYTRVYNYISWIEPIVWGKDKSP